MAAVCVLATVDENGMPQARTLVLRDIPEGLAIYINASSPKWQQSQERGHSGVVAFRADSISYTGSLRSTAGPAHR